MKKRIVEKQKNDEIIDRSLEKLDRMVEKGISLYSISRKIKVKYCTIWRWYHEYYRPSIDNAKKLIKMK